MKNRSISLNMRNTPKMPTVPMLFNIVQNVPANVITYENEIKYIEGRICM